MIRNAPPEVISRLTEDSINACDAQQLLTREWVVANGLGGYASGTIPWIATRRYHGLLVSALPAPLGRFMMLNHLIEELRLPDQRVVRIAAEHPGAAAQGENAAKLTEFRLEQGMPVWRYETVGHVIERRVLFPYRSNTVHVTYSLMSGAAGAWLRLRPFLHFRPHEAAVSAPLAAPYLVSSHGSRIEVATPGVPPLRLKLHGPGAALVLDGGQFHQIEYPLERERGYDHTGNLWSPGYFRADFIAGSQVTLTASTEEWETILANHPAEALAAEQQRRYCLLHASGGVAQDPVAAQLVLAADQFIITPNTRIADAARAHASGDEIRSVIAGYHWFTDWGRDTMISLEGLTLATGRWVEAGYILRTFAHYVRDGLIPNLFPEGEKTGVYHTADATMWFFHTLDRYLQITDDRSTLRLLLPTLLDIVEHHLRGTLFGIHVDPADGLLSQGAPGYQLTWMDAKVGDWVVTPRRGKAVEINALWYNALRLLSGWLKEDEQREDSERIDRHAEQAKKSFNQRFWNPKLGWLYDVIDGEGPDDVSLRPNQIFSIALPHAVLEVEHWEQVLHVVVERLLTPMGLRTLAPGEPNYKPRYDGDLRARDAAYHEGTVWAWLIGPLIDAWLRVYPEKREEARHFLSGFPAHLHEACFGSISEIFDAEAPYTPRGCIAQAWSVAEVLRSWVKTTPTNCASG